MSRLDALARAMAQRELSRRDTLKGAAAVAGGAAVSSPLWGLLEPAQAALTRRRRCKPGHVKCGLGCCAPHQVCVTPKRKRGSRRKPRPRCVCRAPRKQCAAGCVDVRSDPHNCGKCGKRCPVPDGGAAHCNHGVCSAVCAAVGHTVCRNVCVNIQTDASNCGRCGKVCPSGQLCSGGNCVLSCPAGETACGSSCVNTQSDPVNCGACGTSCAGSASGAICISGQCGCRQDGDCPSGSYCAGSVCVADKSQGTSCTADDQCASGHCVGNVCCDSACTGDCAACTHDMTGQPDGTCAPVTVGFPCSGNPVAPVCASNGQCVPAHCANGTKDANETDVDCGGPDCPKCAAGKHCLQNSDCMSNNCVSGVCQS